MRRDLRRGHSGKDHKARGEEEGGEESPSRAQRNHNQDPNPKHSPLPSSLLSSHPPRPILSHLNFPLNPHPHPSHPHALHPHIIPVPIQTLRLLILFFGLPFCNFLLVWLALAVV